LILTLEQFIIMRWWLCYTELLYLPAQKKLAWNQLEGLIGITS
jgi:hypothetical protein